MLTLAVLLFLAVAVGLAALGARYALGPAPADYHAEILRRAGAEIHVEVVRGTRALNVVLGASLLALAAMVAFLAVYGVWADLFWAKLARLAGLLIVGLPTLSMTRRVQAETGVVTPSRPAAVLVGVGGLGLLLAVS